ncbi:hypothetical protein N0V86_008270 [Didymella sp. IMI 355093]|nr:hypothetical protein N0V86_008270 [Didymella sp. IMI 355093]
MTMGQASQKFYDEAPKLHKGCSDEWVPEFWARGVAGMLHHAHEDEHKTVLAETKVIRTDKMEELAQLGINEFFVPAVSKWLLYWQDKVNEDNAKKLSRQQGKVTNYAPGDIGFLEHPDPHGANVFVGNGQVLKHLDDKSKARYQLAWRERTGWLFMRAYERLVQLQSQNQAYKILPAIDALTSEAKEGLLGLKVSPVSKTAPFHLHMVVDALFDLGSRRSDPYEMTQQLVEYTFDGLADFSKRVTALSGGFFNETEEHTLAIHR